MSVDADLVSFDAALVDAGRRVGSECAITHLRSRAYGTHQGEHPYAGLSSTVHTRGGVDHRPVERGWGTETACTGSSQMLSST